MRKPKDPKAEETRPVKEPGHCPFCHGPLEPHCDAARKKPRTCDWIKCFNCTAYGPEDGMVLHP